MTDNPAPFTRSDLARLQEQGGQFRELRDVKWINPREFHRKALADIEDLGYVVGRGSTEGIKIQREAIGEKTGHVESWVYGQKDLTTTASFPWNPYAQFGLATTILGAILAFIGLFVFASSVGAGMFMFLMGGALLAGGIWLLRYRKSEQFLIHGVLTLRLLAQGEATERTIQKPGANVTDLFAQLSVSYAFMQSLEVRAIELMDANFRLAFEKMVAEKMLAFPQLQEIAKEAANAAYFRWPYQSAPFAECLTSDAKKLLADQSKLIGPDFVHLTANLERYGTAIETKFGTVQADVTATTAGRPLV